MLIIPGAAELIIPEAAELIIPNQIEKTQIPLMQFNLAVVGMTLAMRLMAAKVTHIQIHKLT